MFAEQFGTYQCTLAVREAFSQKTHRNIDDSIIEEVLINGTADIDEKDLEIIKATAMEYVKDIFRRLREHGYDDKTVTLYVTGGGGCLIRNFGNYNAKYDGHCHVKVDIYFTVVGMMNVPDEKEIQAVMEEMKNNPKSLKLVS